MTIGNIGNCPYAIFGVGAKKGLDMNNQIELCLEIAVAAHKGQLDKVGLPVILHPLHVGEMGSCEDEICVGFLHDVIEDTSLNGEDLLAKGVARSIVESVLVLTHDKTKTFSVKIYPTQEAVAKRSVKLINIVYWCWHCFKIFFQDICS